MIPGADVVHVLGGGQLLEELDRVRAPSGDIAGQLFQDERGALASAEPDGVGNFGARAGDAGRHSVDFLEADQAADIRDDPRGAGFDELIVVELVQVFGNDRELLFDQHEQRLERSARLLREQLIQLLLLNRRQRCGQSLENLQAGLIGRSQQVARSGDLRVFEPVEGRQEIEESLWLPLTTSPPGLRKPDWDRAPGSPPVGAKIRRWRPAGTDKCAWANRKRAAESRPVARASCSGLRG